MFQSVLVVGLFQSVLMVLRFCLFQSFLTVLSVLMIVAVLPALPALPVLRFVVIPAILSVLMVQLKNTWASHSGKSERPRCSHRPFAWPVSLRCCGCLDLLQISVW